MALYIFLHSSSDADILGLIQVCITTFSNSPPVLARQQPRPQAPNPPQMSRQTTTANTPYPPPPGNGANPQPYPQSNLHPAHSTPCPPTPAYRPEGAAGGYPPYAQGFNQSQLNVSNTGTITRECIKVYPEQFLEVVNLNQ